MKLSKKVVEELKMDKLRPWFVAGYNFNPSVEEFQTYSEGFNLTPFQLSMILYHDVSVKDIYSFQAKLPVEFKYIDLSMQSDFLLCLNDSVHDFTKVSTQQVRAFLKLMKQQGEMISVQKYQSLKKLRDQSTTKLNMDSLKSQCAVAHIHIPYVFYMLTSSKLCTQEQKFEVKSLKDLFKLF